MIFHGKLSKLGKIRDFQKWLANFLRFSFEQEKFGEKMGYCSNILEIHMRTLLYAVKAR